VRVIIGVLDTFGIRVRLAGAGGHTESQECRCRDSEEVTVVPDPHLWTPVVSMLPAVQEFLILASTPERGQAARKTLRTRRLILT
jgi:hypothetical protein